MKKVCQVIKNDFMIYRKYGILQTIIVLSLLLALSMVFLPSLNPLIVIYITVFVLPVIVFSISTFVEKQHEVFFTEDSSNIKILVTVLAKMLSSILLLLFPLLLYLLVMKFYLHMNFNIFLFALVYILSAFMHILIGMVLAIISKNNKNLTISYIAYIIVFSVIPIFYSEGLIPPVFQYLLLVSPAYSSGVLFDQLILGYSRSSDLLTVFAVLIQIIYIFVLSHLVVKPYFKSYLKHIDSKGDSD